MRPALVGRHRLLLTALACLACAASAQQLDVLSGAALLLGGALTGPQEASSGPRRGLRQDTTQCLAALTAALTTCSEDVVNVPRCCAAFELITDDCWAALAAANADANTYDTTSYDQIEQFRQQCGLGGGATPPYAWPPPPPPSAQDPIALLGQCGENLDSAANVCADPASAADLGPGGACCTRVESVGLDCLAQGAQVATLNATWAAAYDALLDLCDIDLPTTSPPLPSPPSGSSSNTGLIAGVAAAVGVAVLAAAAGGIWWYRRRRQRAVHGGADLESKAAPGRPPGGPPGSGPRGGGSADHYKTAEGGYDTFLPPLGSHLPPGYGANPWLPHTAPQLTATGSGGSAGDAAAAAASAATAAVAAAGRGAFGDGQSKPEPPFAPAMHPLPPAGGSADNLPPTPVQLSGGEAQPRTLGSDTAFEGAAAAGGPGAESQDPLSASLETKASAASSGGAAASLHGSGRASGGLEMRPWAVQYSSLQLLKPVGEGSFGKVYLGRWQEIPVACKFLLAGDVGGLGEEGSAAPAISPSLLQKLEEEAGLMLSLRHPHVVNFYGICHDPPAIITEFCQRGSLSDLLARARANPATAAALTWPRRLTLALDAALGMLYLHSRSSPILHRDLKSPNLLVDEHWRAKVADFNLSRILEDSSRSSSLAAMNPRWLAPEVMQGAHATMASDVFSYGVVLWEILTFHLPWGAANPWQLVKLVVGGGRLEVPPRDALPGADTPSFTGLDAYLALMRHCWVQNPSDRPTFSEIIPQLRTLLEEAEAHAAGSSAAQGMS